MEEDNPRKKLKPDEPESAATSAQLQKFYNDLIARFDSVDRQMMEIKEEIRVIRGQQNASDNA